MVVPNFFLLKSATSLLSCKISACARTWFAFLGVEENLGGFYSVYSSGLSGFVELKIQPIDFEGLDARHL
jgi:hypothetical protein